MARLAVFTLLVASRWPKTGVVTECPISSEKKNFSPGKGEATMAIWLGKNQRNVLAELHRHQRWQRRDGWVWSTSLDETERLLDQLVQKGLVVVTEEKLVNLWKREHTNRVYKPVFSNSREEYLHIKGKAK
jgi:hypothetical protein